MNAARRGGRRRADRAVEKQLELAKARFESGTVARLDVLQAEVELANAKAPRIQAKAQVDTSMQALRSVLSLPQSQALQLEGSLDEPVIGHAREELDRELPQRPDLQAFTARRQRRSTRRTWPTASGSPACRSPATCSTSRTASDRCWARQPELPFGVSCSAAVLRARRGGAPRHRAVADAAGRTWPALRDRQRASRARNGVDRAGSVGRGRDDAGNGAELARESVSIAQVSYENGVITSAELNDSQVRLLRRNGC
jgi:outer membrane protein TolC